MAATTNLLRHVVPGSDVWYKDDKEGWCLQQLQELDENAKTVILGDGAKVKMDRVAPTNPPVLDGVEDMIGVYSRVCGYIELPSDFPVCLALVISSSESLERAIPAAQHSLPLCMGSHVHKRRRTSRGC